MVRHYNCERIVAKDTQSRKFSVHRVIHCFRYVFFQLGVIIAVGILFGTSLLFRLDRRRVGMLESPVLSLFGCLHTSSHNLPKQGSLRLS